MARNKGATVLEDPPSQETGDNAPEPVSNVASSQARSSQASKTRNTRSRNQADEQAARDLMIETSGPRRSKQAALDKAIWREAHGRRKRAASVTPPPSQPKVVKKRVTATASAAHVKAKKTVNPAPDECGNAVSDNEGVDIPVPSAPRKQTARKSGPDSTVDDEIYDSWDGDAEQSSVTESDSDIVAVEFDDPFFEDPKNNNNRLSKKLDAERPTWPDDKPSLKHKAMLIIRSRPVEIDVTDSDEEDDSPSVRVASKTPKIEDVSATADASVNKANSAPCASLKGKVWPAYTNVAYSSSGEVGILGQTDEVKVIIRKAIYFMEEFIIFENAFPDLATRAASARKALLKAVNHLIQSKPTHFEHYLVLKRRLKEDPEYVKSLSSVLEQRISNFRRSVRLTAAAAAGSAFRLHLTPSPPRDADSLVKDITNYICPLAANGKDVDYSRPFENEAIIQTIHQEFFSFYAKAIDKEYPDRFPGARNTWKLSNATIALAATAVRAALDEWQGNRWRALPFTANIYTDIYVSHLAALATIEQKNSKAYHAMVCRLYRQVSGEAVPAPEPATKIDIANMSTEI